MHFIIHDMARCSEVDRVDDFIVAIFLVTIEVLGLSSVACLAFSFFSTPFANNADLGLTRVVEKQRVVWLRILH